MATKEAGITTIIAIPTATVTTTSGCAAAWTEVTTQLMAAVDAEFKVARPDEQDGRAEIAATLGVLKRTAKTAKQLTKRLGAARNKFSPDHDKNGMRASLPKVLLEYPLPKDADGVKKVTGEGGALVRPLVAAIQENPESETAMRELEVMGEELEKVYQAEIDVRLADDYLFQTSSEVIATGNGAFVHIYEAMGKQIKTFEPAGVDAYNAAIDRGLAEVATNRTKAGLKPGQPPRNPPTLAKLYQASARAKPVFDEIITKVVEDFNADSSATGNGDGNGAISAASEGWTDKLLGELGRDDDDMEVELLLPEFLKDAIRATEKALLVADPDEVGNYGCVLDVVRALVVCESMEQIAALFDKLLKTTGLKIIRLEEHFFRAPSSSGWRNLTANFNLIHPETGEVICIVEIQVRDRDHTVSQKIIIFGAVSACNPRC